MVPTKECLRFRAINNCFFVKKTLTNPAVYDIINTLMPEPRIWETGFLMKSGFTRPVWDLRLCKYFKR